MTKLLNFIASVWAWVSLIAIIGFILCFIYIAGLFFRDLIIYEALNLTAFVGLLGFLVFMQIFKIAKDITDDLAWNCLAYICFGNLH